MASKSGKNIKLTVTQSKTHADGATVKVKIDRLRTTYYYLYCNQKLYVDGVMKVDDLTTTYQPANTYRCADSGSGERIPFSGEYKITFNRPSDKRKATKTIKVRTYNSSYSTHYYMADDITVSLTLSTATIAEAPAPVISLTQDGTNVTVTATLSSNPESFYTLAIYDDAGNKLNYSKGATSLTYTVPITGSNQGDTLKFKARVYGDDIDKYSVLKEITIINPDTMWRIYDNNSWRKILDCYVYDGSTWRVIDPTSLFNGGEW